VKNIIILTAFLSSLYADAGFYIGANVGGVNEIFKNYDDKKSTMQRTTLKAGYGDIKAYAIEFTLEQTISNEEILSKKDSNRYSFNVELLKAFDFDTFVNPYIKAGFGSGALKISDEKQDKLRFGSYNLGVGTFVPLKYGFEVEVGYSYRYFSYEKIESRNNKVYKSHQNSIYTGVNYRF